MSGPAVWLGGQLRFPQGAGGRIVAAAMGLANRRVLRAAVDALEIRPADSVLDLGCGPGDALPLLAERSGGLVYGIDHAPAMLKLAARRQPDAVLREGTFDRLPLPDASVDRILALNVAYFWYDAAAVLAELRRVLRPGGRLVVYATDGAALARVGLDRAGTHLAIDHDALSAMLGAAATVRRISAGPGVDGWLGIVDAPPT